MPYTEKKFGCDLIEQESKKQDEKTSIAFIGTKGFRSRPSLVKNDCNGAKSNNPFFLIGELQLSVRIDC